MAKHLCSGGTVDDMKKLKDDAMPKRVNKKRPAPDPSAEEPAPSSQKEPGPSAKKAKSPKKTPATATFHEPVYDSGPPITDRETSLIFSELSYEELWGHA